MTSRLAFKAGAVAAAAFVGLVAPAPVWAEAATGAPAALLVYPLISVDGAAGTDTLIQLTNTDDAEIHVRCLYKNPHTTPAGLTAFEVRLLADQPIAWRAGHGLDPVPGDGGTIPALADPFSGTLHCVVAGEAGAPTDRNPLIGSATVERFVDAATVDSARYDALGFDAVAGAPDDDAQLILGGAAAEYAACPASIVLPAVFDGAIVDLGAGTTVQRELSTTVALVTCTQGTEASPASSTVDVAAVNEFGQRLSFSRSVPEHLVSPLSLLDTSNPSQSIFNVNRQGSPAGTIRITPQAGSGVLGVAVEAYTDPNDDTRRSTTSTSPLLVGERTDADVVDLSLPAAPACTGDCNGDGSVVISEVIAGVNIALGSQPISSCPAFDANDDGRVSIDELIAAVNNALGTCPPA